MLNILKENKEFQNIYKHGEKQFGYYSLVYKLRNNSNYNKFGFVVSKKVGNAVCRNRIKRLFKEYCRQNLSTMDSGYDYIIISNKRTGQLWKELTFQNIEKDLKKILKKFRRKKNV